MQEMYQNHLKSVSAVANICSAAMALSDYASQDKGHSETSYNLIKRIRNKTNILFFLSIFISLVFLYSCGGGGGSSSPSPTAQGGGTVAPPPPPLTSRLPVGIIIEPVTFKLFPN